MFQLLTCFDLEAEIPMSEFRQRLADFTAHLKGLELVHSTGPIGRRQRHPIMDTDSERDHEYFFIMSFRDRAQCDCSVEYILAKEHPGESLHRAVNESVKDAIFICWEDL